MGIIDKIRCLSEEKRKVILWTIVIILSFIFLWWWLVHIGRVVRNVSTEKLKEQFVPPIFNQNIPDLNVFLLNLQNNSTSYMENLEKKISPEELELLKILENNLEDNTNTEDGKQ